MPAYNAARTLERTYADIPQDLVDHVILVDDVSSDETVEIARRLGPRGHRPSPEPRLRRQPEDLLRPGARVGRRRRRDAPPRLPVRRDADPRARRADPGGRGGPRARAAGSWATRSRAACRRWKYVSNRFLTGVENAGLRAPPVRVPHGPARLQPAPARDDPVPAELGRLRVRPGAHRAGRRGGRPRRSTRSPCPTRYFEEASSVGFKRSVVYGLSTLRVVARYLLHRTGIRRSAEAACRGRRRASPAPPDDALPPGRPRARGARDRSSRSSRSSSSFRTVDVAAAWQTLKTAQPQLDRSCCSGSSSSTCSCGPSAGGCCWRRSPRCRSGTTLASLNVGYLANNVLPARLGEVVRAHDLGRADRRCRGPRSSGTIVDRAGRRHVRGRRDRRRSRSSCCRSAGSSPRPCSSGSR